MKDTDITIKSVELSFVPAETRVPLKFGIETVTSVTVARVRVEVETRDGRSGTGWGETPVGVQWVWPSTEALGPRHDALCAFNAVIASRLPELGYTGHPMEMGHRFIETELVESWKQFRNDTGSPLPWLGALVSYSAFDIATHDAYGTALGIPVYETYNSDFMNKDLSAYLTSAEDASVSFAGKYPEHFFVEPPSELRAWHLVGGKDPVTKDELTGSEPEDGYPVLLGDWIDRDGLKCLKIKLTGTDPEWDMDRLVAVGKLAVDKEVEWLSTDFNCTVKDPAYVNTILDTLMREHPRIYAMILYVEQPFPYELEEHRIDVRSVSARKPLFMDESAHDWHLVRLGRSLGWTGVALKTCKTQTGALLSMCWAKAHGMTLMVQDLTNPMLAQIPHVLLAAYSGTIMGVETNAMQFYPEASNAEAEVHPGLFARRNGNLDLSTIRGPGFGYRVDEMERPEGIAAADYTKA